MRALRVPKGRVIVEYGSRTDEVFFVVEGELRVLLYSPNGREVSMSAIGPGAMVGEMAAIDGARRAATVVAVTPTKLRAMTRADFCDAAERTPRAALWLARHFSRQIRGLNNKIFELATLNVGNRVHFELLRLGLSSEVRDNRLIIHHAPTHNEIANRIGTNREAVTRTLGDLTEQGILLQKGRTLEILNVEKLSDIVREFSGQTAGIYMAPHAPGELPPDHDKSR